MLLSVESNMITFNKYENILLSYYTSINDDIIIMREP